MWAIPIFLFLIGVFHRAAPGVIAHDLIQAFEATGAAIGRLAATYFYSYATLMAPAELLLDAFGARRVLTAGGAVMSIGALVTGGATGTPMPFTGWPRLGAGASATSLALLVSAPLSGFASEAK